MTRRDNNTMDGWGRQVSRLICPRAMYPTTQPAPEHLHLMLPCLGGMCCSGGSLGGLSTGSIQLGTQRLQRLQVGGSGQASGMRAAGHDAMPKEAVHEKMCQQLNRLADQLLHSLVHAPSAPPGLPLRRPRRQLRPQRQQPLPRPAPRPQGRQRQLLPAGCARLPGQRCCRGGGQARENG